MPTSIPEFTVELEDTRSDQAGKGCGEDVTGVEDGDSCGDFGSGVEVGDDEQSAGVVWRFDNTEEESSEEETDKVLAERGADGEDGPGDHDAAEEERGLDSGHQHVGRDTGDDVSDKEDGDTGLVLNVGDTKILLE